MSDFDSRHGSPHHGQNSAEENMMSGSGNQFGVSGVSNPTTAASISHAAVAANPDAAISAAVEDPDAPVFNPTTAASTSHSAAAADPDATISAAVEDPDSPVSNPTTTASTSHSAAAANPEATISAAVENSDAPVSNPTTTASTSHSAAPANPDAPVSAAPAAFSQQHSPSPSPLTSHQPGPSNPTVFGVVVAGAPWHTMWSNEKPSAFERVDATVAPRKKLAWGSGVSKPTTPTSTSHSTVAANSDAPVSAAPAAFSQQHWPHPPPLTSHQQRPSNPTTFELAAAPWRAMSSNQKPSALEKVDATVAPRKKLVWGSGVSKPTTPTSTSHSTVAANTDAPVSAAPAAFSQQHWPHPSPLTSHQQRPVNRTALEGALRAPPWRAMWGSEKPSALERVDAAVAPRKKLPLGVQGTNGTEKSPGFRMRVDSDDGISDDEGGSAVAPGPGGNRKRNQIQLTCPLSKHPKKKQKHEEPPKHALSLDKLMEFISTWREPCLRHPDESDPLCMLHNIGLSLGVAEWVEDHDTTCLTEDIHAHGEINSSSVPGGHPHENTSMLNDAADDTIKERSKSFHGLEATNNENMDVFDPIEIEADMAELLATNKPAVIEELTLEEAALIIETIRHEEFGLEQTQSYTDDSLLKKQHARLGRALHCLSQELYSQDSHIILELIQNADDNTYIKDVEPTLAFVLQENGIAILNNEKGFCADNIRALCDIGNSTKKGSNMGYIGNKGIGFKSVFRVTDAPEIHSNSFHVKFDITEGQIGFILPTAIPPLDRDPLSRLLSSEDGFDGCSFWNTCILLPFRSSVRKGTDGSFSSIADGPIWLNYDLLDSPSESKISMQSFPVLYNNLRIVSPHILSMSCKNSYIKEEMKTDDLIDILLKIGVQKLSGHDIIKNHILVSLSNATDANAEEKIITEYLSFIMLHLQSSCTSCDSGKEEIVSKLRKRPVLLTNNGYKCPADVPIHFSKHYGNSVDIGKLLQNVDTTWIELDTCYLRHHSSASLQFKLKSWRQFFEELGVTDFVQVVKVEKSISEVDYVLDCTPSQDVISGTPCIVYDWESPELANLLSIFSSKKYRENSIYLLKVLDKTWDDYYSTKSRSLRNATHSGENVTIESSFMKCLRNFKWIASSMDDDLHYARDLFCDLANVRSLLGSVAPYAKPVLSSKSLPKDIGFKTKVSYSDALLILNHWISSKGPFKARMNQMCKLYTFLSEGAANGEINIKRDFLSLCFIFTPVQCSRPTDLVTGRFMSSKDLYWHDPTGSSEMTDAFVSVKRTMLPRRMLSMAYPRLHEFFTEICGVPKIPTTSDYLEILLQLSSVALPSQVANYVFHVFVRWANDLHSGSDKMKDIFYLKESLQKLETTILPTLVDKWVSLHPSFGLVCWADDDQLKQQFTNSSAIEFIQFGELSLDDKQMLCARVAALMDILGIPALSKVVYREAIFYGTGNNRERASFISWLLPYMQRYIYKMHRDTYNSFQQKETMKLSSLEVIVVQKLFFKYMLKGCDSSSKRRFECHCLLQGNILYATQEADSHSVLFELSRLFFGGSGDLHFANFLHMVKTMSESGSTMDQIEFFIVNNQMVPVLPEQESVWSFSSSFVAKEIFTSQTVELQPPYEPSHTLKRKRSPEIISSQPPSKKTGPDLTTSNKSQQEIKVNDMTSLPQLSKPVECGHTEDTSVPVKLEGDHVVKDDLAKENNMLAKKSTTEIGDEPTCLDLEAAISPSPVDETELTDIDEKLADTAEEEDSTDTGSPCGGKLGGDTPGEATVPKPDERSKTGRLGEAVVHQYLVGQLGSSNVKWVNQESETGLPYDIVITPEGGSAEYVEVKATVISNKEWFYVSPREWQFALEKGESFSIAHVLLAGSDKAKIVMLKNPQKLCRQQKVDLNLALVMTRKHRNLHQISVELKPDTISLTDESAS
ncbi:hypothetical protein ACQ4PT_020148 [Festuca glaucescens]